MSKYQMPPCIRKTTIGGQAIIEGIVMKGPKRTCVVVRKADGTLVTEERDSSTPKSRFWRLPICRGAYSLFTALKDGLEDIDYSSKFIEDGEGEEPSKFERWLEQKLGSETLEKAIMAFAMVVGIAIPVGLFMLLPSFAGGLLPEATPNVARNLFEGMLRIAIFLCFMWSVSHMKDIRRTFEYHGAEHKTIFCYEAGLPLTVENVRSMPRFHPRCGTSFLLIVLVVSVLVFSFVTWNSLVIRVLLKLVLLPVTVGISFEIIRYAGRYSNPLTRLISAPGLWLQRLTTAEPDTEHIEVAIASMLPCIPSDGSDQWGN